jgi:hypothetical protein
MMSLPFASVNQYYDLPELVFGMLNGHYKYQDGGLAPGVVS